MSLFSTIILISLISTLGVVEIIITNMNSLLNIYRVSILYSYIFLYTSIIVIISRYEIVIVNPIYLRV